jgi:hypothetical protein
MRRPSPAYFRISTLSPILALAFCASAAASDFPSMRPGFWMNSTVMHMNMAGQPPDTDNTPRITYNCEDADSLHESMKKMAGIMPGCTSNLAGSGSVYTFTMNCTNPGGMKGSSTGTGTFTLNGETDMQMTGSSTADMDNMHMTMNMTGESKWMGACPAGTVPGDFGTLTNGVFKKEGNTLTDNMKMPAPPPGN